MDSGTSGGSMQSGGSSREDDQNDTSSFSAGVASIPRLHNQNYLDYHQLHLTTHLHQQPSFSSQQHIHHYPSLTNMNTTRDDHDNNISCYNNLSPHLFSTNSIFLETLPQSDLDPIWSSMTMNVNPNPHHHNHHQQQQQQQLLYASTSLLTPSSSTMDPNQAQTTNQDPQPRPIRKVSSLATLHVKENGSSSCRVVKKRTRASRKTPTTVLTTDTTNFRAMVQEFTGIPTPPFSPSSLFPAKKFDIFGTNNGLDHHQHPSLGTLLFSLNKSINNNNNNPNPSSLFAHPSITTASPINPLATERIQSGNPNPYQDSQQMMLPQGSNSTILNQTQGSDHMIKNPTMSFHYSSSLSKSPPFQSKYAKLGNESDQVGAFSNVERGENDNISKTS